MELATVDRHRAEINAVTALAQNDIGSYAQSIQEEDPGRVAAQLRAATPAVVATYGDVAATSGALFYENNRPKPGFTAELASPSIADALTSELGWAFLPLFKPDGFDDPGPEMVGRLLGVTQKYVALYDRDTLDVNARRDQLALGVRRYARANACAFCAYLTSIDATAHEGTKWHNDCHCVSVPWWEDNPLPTNPHMERWADVAGEARAELERLQAETPRNGMKKKAYFAAHPELAVNTENITRIMRRKLNLAH